MYVEDSHICESTHFTLEVLAFQAMVINPPAAIPDIPV